VKKQEKAQGTRHKAQERRKAQGIRKQGKIKGWKVVQQMCEQFNIQKMRQSHETSDLPRSSNLE